MQTMDGKKPRRGQVLIVELSAHMHGKHARQSARLMWTQLPELQPAKAAVSQEQNPSHFCRGHRWQCLYDSRAVSTISLQTT